jgi:hypothetical protein
MTRQCGGQHASMLYCKSQSLDEPRRDELIIVADSEARIILATHNLRACQTLNTPLMTNTVFFGACGGGGATWRKGILFHWIARMRFFPTRKASPRLHHLHPAATTERICVSVTRLHVYDAAIVSGPLGWGNSEIYGGFCVGGRTFPKDFFRV